MCNQKGNPEKLPTWQEFQSRLIAKAINDESFRKELLANPKAVIESEMGRLKDGAKLPATLEIKVIEQPANVLYVVLPPMSDELSDEALDSVAGGKEGSFCYDGDPCLSNFGCVNDNGCGACCGI